MAEVTPTQAALRLENRILGRLQRIRPDDPQLALTLFRIGLGIEKQAKVNIRNRGLIDNGHLFNSIRTMVNNKGVIVGSFNLPYAAIHEFGGTIKKKDKRLTIPVSPEYRNRRAGSFSDLRVFFNPRSGKTLLVKDLPNGEFKVAYVLKDSVKIKKKPYMRPALLSQRQEILNDLRTFYRSRIFLDDKD